MMTRVLYRPTTLIVLAWMIATTQAEENWIIQWNPNIPAHKYSIDQGAKSITINQGDFGIFKFEAIDLDTPYPHEPGDIDAIVAETAGQVRVAIGHNPQHPRIFGARNVEEINLSDAHPGWLELVTISGDLGRTGGVHVVRFNNHVGVHGDILGNILASSCLGNFSIAGDVLASIEIYTISGSFAIHGDLLAPFDARTLADFAVNGAGPHTGDITVKYAYPDDLTIAGDYAGDMSFLQGISGQLVVEADLTGSITAAGDLTGSITVQDDVAADGLIAVGGDLDGFIKIDDALAGQIRVHGSLLNGPEVNDIWVGTGLDTTGAIAVDYDGWDASDTWASGAVVRVGQTTYTQNTPAARVYEITECRGDMNNDGSVDFGDINPFVLARRVSATRIRASPAVWCTMETSLATDCWTSAT